MEVKTGFTGLETRSKATRTILLEAITARMGTTTLSGEGTTRLLGMTKRSSRVVIQVADQVKDQGKDLVKAQAEAHVEDQIGAQVVGQVVEAVITSFGEETTRSVETKTMCMEIRTGLRVTRMPLEEVETTFMGMPILFKFVTDSIHS